MIRAKRLWTDGMPMYCMRTCIEIGQVESSTSIHKCDLIWSMMDFCLDTTSMHSCRVPTRGQRTPPPRKHGATSGANGVSTAKLEFQTEVLPRATEHPVVDSLFAMMPDKSIARSLCHRNVIVKRHVQCAIAPLSHQQLVGTEMPITPPVARDSPQPCHPKGFHGPIPLPP